MGDEMSCLAVYKDCNMDTTLVSNIFIDEFMKDANDAQLKVYFYLLRMVNANLPTSVAAIAEKLNHTEREVVRSLKYWEKKDLLALDFNDAKELTGIHFRNLSSSLQDKKTTATPVSVIAPIVPITRATQVQVAQESIVSEEQKYIRPHYNKEDMKNFHEMKDSAELMFLAETYLSRTLSPDDLHSLYFFIDVLNFTPDLIDYLLQYCAGIGKTRFPYIEKVAISWANNRISTVSEAQLYLKKQSPDMSIIMKALGRNTSSPTSVEFDMISTWKDQFHFSMDIILEACSRTVLAVDTNRFVYANTVLKNWFDAGVKSLSDISAYESAFRNKTKQRATVANTTKKSNTFNQFSQRSYDFEALEKELLN